MAKDYLYNLPSFEDEMTPDPQPASGGSTQNSPAPARSPSDFYSLPSYLPPSPPEPPINIEPVPTGTTVRSGVFKSPRYTPNQTGWQLDGEGNSEFNKMLIRNTFITVPINASIQDAINIMAAQGGGEVRLGSGTYYPTGDINIPSNVALIGVGSNSIIDFQNQAYGIKSVGTDTYNTGTVAVNNGSSTVTGTGTTWTTAMEGRNILIGELWYYILTVNSTTSITLEGTFQTASVTGQAYTIATTVDIPLLKNFLVQNSSTALVKAQYVNGLTIDSVIMFNGAVGLDGDDSAFINIWSVSVIDCDEGMNFNNFSYGTYWNNNIENSTNNGFTGNTISNWGFEIFTIRNNGGDGMNFSNCTNNGLEDFTCSENGGDGIELLAGNSKLTFDDGTINNNGGDGVKLTATSDSSQFMALDLSGNGGYGMNIAASSCDGNIIVANNFSGNATAAASDSGTGTVIRSNYGLSDNTPPYFNIQFPFMVSAAINWIVSSSDITIPDGGAMASFGGTGADELHLEEPLYTAAGSLARFNSTNILILDWWAKLPTSPTGDINMGFGTEALSFQGVYNDTSGNGAKVAFALSGTTLYAVIAEEGIGATTTDITSGITVTNWNNYRIELDLSNEAKFYVNGSLKATLSGANLEVDNMPIWLGFGRSNTAAFIVTAPTLSMQMNP